MWHDTLSFGRTRARKHALIVIRGRADAGEMAAIYRQSDSQRAGAQQHVSCMVSCLQTPATLTSRGDCCIHGHNIHAEFDTALALRVPDRQFTLATLTFTALHTGKLTSSTTFCIHG